MKRIIKSNEYSNRDDLTYFEIPEGIEIIEDGAFSNCKNLEFVIMPDSVRLIGAGAFKKCENLKEINLSENLLKISDTAFSGCSNLEGIIFPDNLTEIGDETFGKCMKLKEVIITESVEKIGNHCFRECTSLEKAIFKGENTIIGDCAFYSDSSLIDVILPAKLEIVSSCLFDGCSNLTNINIPSSVNKIMYNAFYATNLEAIDLENTAVTLIDDRTFEECKNLKMIKLPKNLEKIGRYAFEGSGLEKIDFPDTLKELDIKAFTGCSRLERVKFNDNLKRIPNDCFCYCVSLKNVMLPNNLTEISDRAFCDCHSIEDIVFPNALKYIGVSAFSSTSLKDVTFPKSLLKVSSYAFSNTKIKHIVIPSAIAGNASVNIVSGNLEKIKFEEGCKSVGLVLNSFEENKAIKQIIFPKTVRSFTNTYLLRDSICDIDVILNTSLFYIPTPNFSYYKFFRCDILTINGVKVNLTKDNAGSIILKLQKEEIKKLVLEKLSEKQIIYSKKDINYLNNKLIKIILTDKNAFVMHYENCFKIDDVIENTINNYLEENKLNIEKVKEQKLLPSLNIESKSFEEIYDELKNYKVKEFDINNIKEYGNDLNIYPSLISNLYVEATNKALKSNQKIESLKKAINDNFNVAKILLNKTSAFSYDELSKFIVDTETDLENEIIEYKNIQKLIYLYSNYINLMYENINALDIKSINNDVKIKLLEFQKKVVSFNEECKKIDLRIYERNTLLDIVSDIKVRLLPLTIMNSADISMKLNDKKKKLVFKEISNLLRNKRNDNDIQNSYVIKLDEMPSEFKKEFEKKL